MKLEDLFEFRKNVPQGAAITQDQLAAWVKDSILLKLQFVIPNEKSITCFEYDEFGPNDKFLILTDRVNKDDIVGYMYISRVHGTEYWQVKDGNIFNPYQKRGLGLDFYVKLIKNGYKLINGFSLSTEAEKLWRKLSQHVSVYTWDKETNTISEFDERPTSDNTLVDDNQRYFWLAETRHEHLEECENSAKSTFHWYIKWLEGSTSTPGGFHTTKYSKEGDF